MEQKPSDKQDGPSGFFNQLVDSLFTYAEYRENNENQLPSNIRTTASALIELKVHFDKSKPSNDSYLVDHYVRSVVRYVADAALVTENDDGPDFLTNAALIECTKSKRLRNINGAAKLAQHFMSFGWQNDPQNWKEAPLLQEPKIPFQELAVEALKTAWEELHEGHRSEFYTWGCRGGKWFRAKEGFWDLPTNNNEILKLSKKVAPQLDNLELEFWQQYFDIQLTMGHWCIHSFKWLPQEDGGVETRPEFEIRYDALRIIANGRLVRVNLPGYLSDTGLDKTFPTQAINYVLNNSDRLPQIYSEALRDKHLLQQLLKSIQSEKEKSGEKKLMVNFLCQSLAENLQEYGTNPGVCIDSVTKMIKRFYEPLGIIINKKNINDDSFIETINTRLLSEESPSEIRDSILSP